LLEDKVWKVARAHQWAHPFLTPVTEKIAPGYFAVVKRPIDLATIRDKIRAHEYKKRDDFLADLKLMVENCHRYNEARNPHLPPMADEIYTLAEQSLNKIDQFAELEQEIASPKNDSDDAEDLFSDDDDEMVEEDEDSDDLDDEDEIIVV